MFLSLYGISGRPVLVLYCVMVSLDSIYLFILCHFLETKQMK